MMSAFTQWLFGRQRQSQGEIWAALDIGSSKIACFIARADENGLPRVVGIGHQYAEGMRCGLVADMEAVQRAISASVATAEEMAGEIIEKVIVNIAAPHLKSLTAFVELPLNGREITAADIERILSQGQAYVADDAQGHMMDLLHTIPVHYALDGQKGIRDPSGMVGNMLQAQLHLVCAAFGPVRTLLTAVAKCHLEVSHLVAAPYASGLACLVEDEMDLGCTVIDMGAGTTSMGVFFDGQMIYADGVPVGGMHITNDIARGLTTPLHHAERLKTLYGNAMSSQMDEGEILDVPQIGEESPGFANHVPKSHLTRIIQPRMEEIFELVRAKLEGSGFSQTAGRRVVLTGGGCQMPGVRDLAQRLLDKQVRLGRPLRIARPQLPTMRPGGTPISSTGLAEATSGPAFATAAGLLAVAMQPDLAPPPAFMEFGNSGFLSRTSQWFKHNM